MRSENVLPFLISFRAASTAPGSDEVERASLVFSPHLDQLLNLSVRLRNSASEVRFFGIIASSTLAT